MRYCGIYPPSKVRGGTTARGVPPGIETGPVASVLPAAARFFCFCWAVAAAAAAAESAAGAEGGGTGGVTLGSGASEPGEPKGDPGPEIGTPLIVLTVERPGFFGSLPPPNRWVMNFIQSFGVRRLDRHVAVPFVENRDPRLVRCDHF